MCSVSYTHLDVYKRQDQERSAVCLKYARKMDLQLIVCVPDERLQSLIRNVAVSYTHLDVYKRQVEKGMVIAGKTASQLEEVAVNSKTITFLLYTSH